MPLRILGVCVAGLLASAGVGVGLRNSRCVGMCRRLSSVAFIPVMAFHIAVRVVVLWEACQTPAFLPLQAFHSSWSISWPHVQCVLDHRCCRMTRCRVRYRWEHLAAISRGRIVVSCLRRSRQRCHLMSDLALLCRCECTLSCVLLWYQMHLSQFS